MHGAQNNSGTILHVCGVSGFCLGSGNLEVKGTTKLAYTDGYLDMLYILNAKAFYNCKKLTSITIKTTKLTTKNVGKKAFTKTGSSNYKKLTVKVPKKKLKAYKTMLKKRGLSSKAKVKK